ncbi:hypothetical protein [uncultured Microbulbifer sp.]|uniref:hypothetical protein n=1 Tax=uncultured Microbulbifer sp. TaxID=348147 RepID=UPI0026316545|nr:hypothetical protein [uncultured Microbulbifer sp.]
MKGVYIDPLFGEIDTRKSTPRVDLSNVTDVADRLPAQSFKNQLGRLLRDNDGKVDVIHYSSCPDFERFLEKIPKHEIDCIYIGQRTDQNKAVKATLDCTLFLSDGVLRVIAQWCAYKDIRAQEIVDTLLVPIMSNDFTDRTFIKWSHDEIESLPNDMNIASGELFTLSGYPPLDA